MKIFNFLLVFLLALGLLTTAGCGGKQVTRVASDTTIDLSGKWNDTDSRIVSEELTADMMSAPWLGRFEGRNNDERPTVIVGLVRNMTDEHIATEVFTKEIERASINSGRVRIVASSTEREGLRDERSDQADFSSAATVKKFGMEHGADYMLLGTINKVRDASGGDEVLYYQVDLQLTDIETNETVWLGGTKHKKFVGKSAYKG